MTVLLTGGSGCGKSSFAEGICVKLPLPRYYIATMQPYGQAGAEKIARHHELRRGKGFETYERYHDLAALDFPEKGTVLLECIANITANEMFSDNGDIRDPYEDVIRGVEALREKSNHLVIVTNDVGSDGGNYSPETHRYIDVMGRINARLAAEADVVIEMVCGIPIMLKGELSL